MAEKDLNGPRITLAQIESKIVKELYYVFPSTEMTVCCIVLENGFSVSGESACASPENFDRELGEDLAKDKAIQKIWALEAYLLKERMAEDCQIDLIAMPEATFYSDITLDEEVPEAEYELDLEKIMTIYDIKKVIGGFHFVIKASDSEYESLKPFIKVKTNGKR